MRDMDTINIDCGFKSNYDYVECSLIQLERDLKLFYPSISMDMDEFKNNIVQFGYDLANVQNWFNQVPIVPELTGLRNQVKSRILRYLAEYYDFSACIRRGKIPYQMYIPEEVTIKFNLELHDGTPDYVTMYSGDVEITGSVSDMETLIGHAHETNLNEVHFEAGTYIRDYVSSAVYWDKSTNFVQIVM
jgi:hypothetical protein